MKTDTINPLLLQNTGGSPVFSTTHSEERQTYITTANALTFHSLYLEFPFSFPLAIQSHHFFLTLVPLESRHKGVLWEEATKGNCNLRLPTYVSHHIHSSNPLRKRQECLSKAHTPSHHRETFGPHLGGPAHPGYDVEMTITLSFKKGTLSHNDWIF